VLFVAAAFAKGRTVARGAHELRVKESDRIAAMKAALEACGVPCEEYEDGLAITGTGGDAIPGGGRIASQLDHRIAMSMTVAGLHAARPVTIDDVAPVATSYPVFYKTLDEVSEEA
jgi:3-phosphoshikimate 1-carboxyvinyltransferase